MVCGQLSTPAAPDAEDRGEQRTSHLTLPQSPAVTALGKAEAQGGCCTPQGHTAFKGIFLLQ